MRRFLSGLLVGLLLAAAVAWGAVAIPPSRGPQQSSPETLERVVFNEYPYVLYRDKWGSSENPVWYLCRPY